MKDNERGSLTVLGLFLTLALLVTAEVTLDANSLYLQQRQVNNLSDALALDLADLLRVTDSSEVTARANGELELLNATGREALLNKLEVLTPKVRVRLCQSPAVFFNLNGFLKINSQQVCAESTATSF